jgi:HK97 family phage major capsid protein
MTMPTNLPDLIGRVIRAGRAWHQFSDGTLLPVVSGGDGSGVATTPTLTYPQAKNRLKDIADEMERLDAKAAKSETRSLEDEDQKYHDDLFEEARGLHAFCQQKERENQRAELKRMGVARAAGTATAVRGSDDMDADPLGEPDSIEARRFRNPWDVSEIRMGLAPDARSAEFRARALCAIERMQGATDKVRETGTVLVERASTDHTAQVALATSSPEYLRAFAKLYRSNGNMATLDADESRAVARAMSLTDAAGGYLIPFQLDPTVILTATGSRNQVRQISRVVQATGDTWSGISSAGVTGSWDAEAAEVSDDAPTFAQPQIPVYKLNIFVPASVEVAQDAQNLTTEVGRMIAFEKDRMEGVAFVTGTGTGEPTGIVTALTGTASVVASATTDTFASADVYALDSALPARHRANASWLGHRAIYNLVRRFDTQGGANLWETIGGGMPAQLLGQNAYEAEAMDSTITALAANPVLVYGDFENYVIADRIGTQIQYIPFLMGANRRPTGQVGWYAYARTGADSVQDGAFRMLDVT